MVRGSYKTITWCVGLWTRWMGSNPACRLVSVRQETTADGVTQSLNLSQFNAICNNSAVSDKKKNETVDIFPPLAPHPCICSKQDNLVSSLHDRRLSLFPRRPESTSLPQNFPPLSSSASSRLLLRQTRNKKLFICSTPKQHKLMNMYTPYNMAPTLPPPPPPLFTC